MPKTDEENELSAAKETKAPSTLRRPLNQRTNQQQDSNTTTTNNNSSSSNDTTTTKDNDDSVVSLSGFNNFTGSQPSSVIERQLIYNDLLGCFALEETQWTPIDGGVSRW